MKLLWLFVILSQVILISTNPSKRYMIFEDLAEHGPLDEYKVPLDNVIRCSRRYRPGHCTEPVVSVWTYVYTEQNCTERFGCALIHNSNRFLAYSECMNKCKPLMDIYTYIMSHKSKEMKDIENVYDQSMDSRRRNASETRLERIRQLSDDEEAPSPLRFPEQSPLQASDGRVFAPDIDRDEGMEDDVMEQINF